MVWTGLGVPPQVLNHLSPPGAELFPASPPTPPCLLNAHTSFGEMERRAMWPQDGRERGTQTPGGSSVL